MSRIAFLLLLTAWPLHAEEYRVGTARVDITPKYGVRLNGFGFRRDESQGVTQPIKARALAIEDDTKKPALLITVDVLGIPAEVRQEVGKRLEKKAGLDPRRLTITATHTHTAPMLSGANTTIFGQPIPKDHQTNIDRYTTEFLERLEEVGLAALKERRSARLSWGVGQVGFARNRRQGSGPVDHDLPILVARDLKGKVIAVHLSYACHCVTLSNNKISGDWAGYAAQAVEDAFPEAVALVSIGCGADANPSSGVTGADTDAASRQGLEIGKEVERLTKNYLAPVSGRIAIREQTLELPLAKVPDRAEWEKRAERKDAVGHHARVQLEKLERKESIPTKVDYLVQTWAFGDGLALAFLPGEVVVDYGLRLKKELDCGRLIVVAYANDDPCYIPSERVLKEGGYEGGGAMVYYDLAASFAPGLEEKIHKAVHEQIGKTFAAPHDPARLQGTRPLSPQQSLAALRTKAKLAVDLVAAEPLVIDPVAIDFGPDGRLWVAEMIDYPSGKQGKFEPGGRVRSLTDSDGDGVFDSATVFLDGIPFPTGLTVWRKGLLVCAAPDILYAEDSDGDGKADVVKKLFSGFGTGNYQARVNSLTYGLDGWVHGACGLFGGTITSAGREKPLALGNRDFRLKPDTGDIEPATGTTQQGRVRDDHGNWFGCDNSMLLRHYVLPDHYLRRNPHVALASPSVLVPDYPGSNRMYPALERVQQFRLTGPAHHVTSACGIGVYRDELLGQEFSGDAFTCEPVNLVVHRLELSPRGSTFSGRRAADEQQSEFLTSTDPWCRPVQVKTGPDGCLWVVDMYRFVIEHPRWIPPDQLAEVDMRAGQTRGRIYRVRPRDTAPRPWPRLDRLDTAGLVAALDSPNGWQRDLAGQMLLWQADAAAVPALEKLASDGKRAEGRLHALCTLDGLEALKTETIEKALADSDPAVRRQAVRLAEKHLDRLGSKVARLVEDSDAQVRLQVALTLGEWKDARSGESLARLMARHGDDVHLRAAVLSSVRGDNLAPLLAGALGQPAVPAEMGQALVRLAVVLDGGKQLPGVIEQVTRGEGRWQPWQLAALAGLLEVADQRGPDDRVAVALRKADGMLNFARQRAVDVKAPQAERLAALQLLGRRKGDHEVLTGLLDPRESTAVQGAAVLALVRGGSDEAVAALVEGWRGYSPALKGQVLDGLLSRSAWHAVLLTAVEKKTIAGGEIDPARRQRLLQSKDRKVREQAAKLFEAGSEDRRKVVQEYQSALKLAGDVNRGKAEFIKHCAVCHQFQGAGHKVGPALDALAIKTAPYLLTEILDPNRNLDTRHVEYQATMRNGRTFTGLLAAETSTSVTLLGQEGKSQTLLRQELDALGSSGRSLMPEGLEKVLPAQAMADVLAYLTSVPGPFKRLPGNEPVLVRPKDGKLILLATQCEIYGGEITFETEFKNIGWWRGVKDHVVWRAELEKEATFDVWLDYACENASAGNRWALETSGGEKVSGTVSGTGGWDRYRTVKVGTLRLGAGRQTLTFRPDGHTVSGALIDLRGVHLLPSGSRP